MDHTSAQLDSFGFKSRSNVEIGDIEAGVPPSPARMSFILCSSSEMAQPSQIGDSPTMAGSVWWKESGEIGGMPRLEGLTRVGEVVRLAVGMPT